MKKITKIILPVFSLLLGVFWTIYGLTQYGWWGDNGPQSGFFPAILGIVLFLVSLLGILSADVKSGHQIFSRVHWYPVLAVISVILISMVTGFFPALSLFILVWVKFYEQYNWKISIMTTIVTVVIFYGIFSLWLQVPFPRGILSNILGG